MKIGSYLSLGLIMASVSGEALLASARSSDPAYDNFDYKAYAKSANLPEGKFSKRQFWDLFRVDPKMSHKPTSWFHPKQFQKLFPLVKGTPVTPYNVYRTFLAGGVGVRERAEGEAEEIISATTHGDRIETAWMALESALRQARPAHQVILWLYKEDYPQLYKDRATIFTSKHLPASLKALGPRGLAIRFTTKDYKVATKLLPTLEAFPDAFVTTIDDDRIYSPNLTQALWNEHISNPECIVSPHVRSYVTYPNGGGINYLAQDVVYPDDGTTPLPGPYGPCHPHYGPPLFGIFEGFSGVFYPPHALGTKVISDFPRLFHKLTPCADDVWYQGHAILTGTKVVGLPKAIGDAIYNPPEIDGTQASGLWHRHLDANSYMADKLFWYYDLFEKLGIPFNPSVLCQACARPVPMVREGETFPKHATLKGTECHMCLNNDQKTLLVLGAAGYGNIGDSFYPAVFQHLLKDNFRVVYGCDTVRVAPDGSYMILSDPRPDVNFDALVVGGGGILTNAIDPILAYHLQRALALKKPLIFLSVGLQTTLKNPTPTDVRQILTSQPSSAPPFSPVRHESSSSSSAQMGGSLTFDQASSSTPAAALSMLDFLEYAHLIFARTSLDARLLQGALSADGASKVRYYPDLGYLAPDAFSITPSHHKKYVTFIPTGSVHTGLSTVQEQIKLQLDRHPGAKLLVMNWGGLKDPRYPETSQDRILVAQAKEDFPHAKVYFGDSVSQPLQLLRYQHKTIAKSDLTPKKALEKIAKSHHVITGRLHGMIEARALGVPYTVMDFSHKLTAEANVTPDTDHARMALTHLTHYLERGGPALPTPSLWNEDTRNHLILRTSGLSGFAIQVIQQFENQTIYDFLAFDARPSQNPHVQARSGSTFPIPTHPETWDENARNNIIVRVDNAHTGHTLSQIQSMSNGALFHLLNLKDALAGNLATPLTHFFAHDGASQKDPSTWSEEDRNARINFVHEKDPSLGVDLIQAMDNVTLYKFLAFGVHPLNG